MMINNFQEDEGQFYLDESREVLRLEPLNRKSSVEVSPHYEFSDVIHGSIGKLLTQQNTNYTSLLGTTSNTKNIPKTFGNNVRKYLVNCFKRGDIARLPPTLKKFLNKKCTGKQSNYTLQDFRDVAKEKNLGQSILLHYLENTLYLDLINSNRVADPSQYILFNEQYLSGCTRPDQFLGNRLQKINQLTGVNQVQSQTNQNYNLESVSQDEQQVFQQTDEYSVAEQWKRNQTYIWEE